MMHKKEQFFKDNPEFIDLKLLFVGLTFKEILKLTLDNLQSETTVGVSKWKWMAFYNTLHPPTPTEGVHKKEESKELGAIVKKPILSLVFQNSPESISYDTKSDFSFKNREVEVKEIYKVWAQNINLSTASKINTEGYSTLMTAQMFGLGKSALGEKFRERVGLISEEDRKAIFFSTVAIFEENSFNIVDNYILNHQYIQIDLRNYENLFMIEELDCLPIRIILLKELLKVFPTGSTYFEDRSLEMTTSRDIVSYFAQKLKQKLFIHLDEIDTITTK